MIERLTRPLAMISLSLCCQFVTAEALPEDVETLKAKRNQAVQKIDATYYAELEKLKVKYTKAGNLEAANRINGMLEDLALNSSAVIGVDNFSVVGRWVFEAGNRKRYFNFNGDMSFTGQFAVAGDKFSGTWRVEGKRIVLFLDGKKRSDYVEIISDDQLLFVGSRASMKGQRG